MRGKAVGIRSRGQGVPHRPTCNGRVPVLHGRTISLPVRCCPPDPRIGSSGIIRSMRAVRPPPLFLVCFAIANLHRDRSPHQRPPKAALCGAVGRHLLSHRHKSVCEAAVESSSRELCLGWAIPTSPFIAIIAIPKLPSPASAAPSSVCSAHLAWIAPP